MENALVHSGRRAGLARRAGVLIRACWGDRRLASEFVPFGKPRAFTVGLEEGCDFAAPGVRRFELVQVDGDGAVVRFTRKMTGERLGPEGVTPLAELAQGDGAAADGDAHAVELESRDVVRVEVGGLAFEVFRLKAPPMEQPGFFENVDFTWANLMLALLALAGVFILYAANREAEGVPLADDLSSEQLRLVKTLQRIEPPRPAPAAEAIARPAKEGKMVGAPQPHQPPRPSTASHAGRSDMKQLVANLFAAQAGHGVFAAGGLGDELEKNVGGIVGAGLGGNGLGLKDLGPGFGGSTVGIGRIGVHGHGKPYGTSATGTDCGMKCKDSRGPFIDPAPAVVTCGSGGECMDKDLIRKVIHENIAKFRFCYESRLNSNPKLAGKVSVRFSIAPSGVVPTAAVAQSTVGDAVLDECVVGRTRLLNFPARHSEGLVLVTYPFVFRSGAQ